MISLNFNDEGTIHTVLTGDRSKMNKESFGWKMAKCSEFAYLNGKEAKSKYKDLGFSRHRYFDVDGAQCHAAYDKEWFVLAFRGTEVKSWSDIKADLNMKMKVSIVKY